MNYRHAYHAGNFADVVKHLILVLVIEHLKQKPAPFRVIDTHAGTGLYDLAGEEAQKTGEWRHGIGRLLGEGAAELPTGIGATLKPYLDIGRALNAGDRIERYPGSPWIARRLLRPDDRMIATELHPEDARSLGRLCARDPQVKVIELDGWLAPRSFLPPKERRGVVLIDAPFEAPDELTRLVVALRDGVERFAQGIFLAWYPIKALQPVHAFKDAVKDLLVAKAMTVEVLVREPKVEDHLNGAGLVILNTPWTLPGILQQTLPWLAQRLAQGEGARALVTDLGDGRAR